MNQSVRLSALSENDRVLVDAARETIRNAYAPYSSFAVGAAVRSKNGAIYRGANLENASYGVTMCAEVAALTYANTAGDFEIEAIAIVGASFQDESANTKIVTPCGRCRQMLVEASQIAQTELRVLSCNFELTDILVASIAELLPAAFGPANIGLVKDWPSIRAKIHALADRKPLSLKKKAASAIS
ncbi:MAG TPA: cytidine deaminase [Stellaceae bacterium]|nr:cytidine deaminase [Stellaceae bacterium]